MCTKEASGLDHSLAEGQNKVDFDTQDNDSRLGTGGLKREHSCLVLICEDKLFGYCIWRYYLCFWALKICANVGGAEEVRL